MPSSINSRPAAFTILAKPAGAACNLACEYCFYHSKEALYPGQTSRMTDEVLKAYIKQLLRSQPIGEVSISWQGGEPTLMGLEFFQRSIKLAKLYQKPEQRITYSIQTNGTLLDDEWCEFFKKHNFLVGLSLDGPHEMHDAYRVNIAGQGSYDRVRQAWELLQQHQVETNILCAVHAANADHPLDIYRFFRDELQAKFIQFIPIVERAGSGGDETSIIPPTGQPAQKLPGRQTHSLVSSRSVKPAQFGNFLAIIFDAWLQHDVGKVFIQPFDSALASWCRIPANVCIFQEVCGSSLVLEHNGDLYSCDHFVDQEHLLGNILEKPMAELARSSRQRQFGLDKHQNLPKTCLECEFLFACRGECPRNHFMHTHDGEPGLNYLCTGYKEFFRHIDQPMREMAGLLRQGRSAAEIMSKR